MKKRFLKVVAVVATIAILSACVALFASCNKNKTRGIEDIFVNRSSSKEFTKAEALITLPANWTVYTPSSTSGELTSDTGYIKALDAFVVQSDLGSLTLMKCHDDRVFFDGGYPGQIFPLYTDIRALRVKDGYIACRFGDGKVGAFDYNGATVLSRDKSKQSSGVSIDSLIKILGGGMFAIAKNYDVNGVDGFTSIYRATYSGSVTDRGSRVCRVQNEAGDLSYINGFDGKYVSVVGNSAGSYIFRVPDSGNGGNLEGNSKNTVATNGESDYYSEITYIGNGRFYIHEDWTVEQSEDFMYYDGFDYYCYKRSIYTPDNGARSDYNDNQGKLFAYMSNNYYTDSKAGIDTRSYLKEGYTYASYGLTIINKVGYYDQFILDSDLNIVMSLTGNYGITIKDQKKEVVGHFDLIMNGVDGNYYIPVAPSSINIYNKDGSLVGHNDRDNAVLMELNNNVLITQVPVEGSSNSYLFGAYNIKGEEIIPFKYLSLTPFRGSYTIAERRNEESVRRSYVIGIDGKEVEYMSDGSIPLSDMATTSSGVSIYKIGCYMFRKDSGEKDKNGAIIYRYGIKNFNPNVQRNILMDAVMESGSVLYSPASAADMVFVFEKITNNDNVVYTIWQMV